MHSYKNFSSVSTVLMLLAILTCSVERASGASKSSEQTVAQARALIDEDRIEPALTILNTLLGREPANAWALSERSRAFRKTGKIEKADIDANKAVALAPKSAVLRINRVSQFEDAKKYQLAVEECDKAIALDPLFDRAYTVRANAFEHWGKYDEAIRDCDKAISLAPNSPHNYLLRGSTRKRKGQLELAERDLKKALELSIKSPHYNHIERGSIYFCLNKFEDAISECIADLDFNPDSVDAHYLRANAYSKLGRFQDEIDDLTEALKLVPRDSDMYELRAVAEYKLFQHSAAIKDCESAFKLAPDSTLKPLMAATYDELGEHQKAHKIREQILEKSKTSDVHDGEQRKKFEANFKDKESVLAFNYDEGGHLAVPANIDEQQLQLMLDTGSEITDIWKTAIKKLNLNPTYNKSFEQADGKKRTSGQITVKKFDLGAVQFSDAQFDVDDGLANHKTLSGFLGSNVLKNFAVKIEYASKKVVLTESCDSSLPKNSIIVPLIIRNDCPFCFVRIDDKLERPALLDTGSPSCIAADALLEPVLPKDMEYTNQMQGPWLGNIDSETIRLKKIGFTNFSLKDPLCDVFKASQAPRAACYMTIGNDFFSRFKTVTFDYPGKRVIFEPAADSTDSAWSAYSEARFCLQQHDDRGAVSHLNQFLEAEPTAGKIYLCIRGRAYLRLKEYQKALDDFDQFLRDCPGDPYALVMRATVHGELMEFDKAIEDDTAAIKTNPSYRFAYENRAWAYEILGEKQLAESDREIANKLK